MRPFRQLLALATSFVLITLLISIIFGPDDEDVQTSASPVKEKGRFSALLSFTSPGSLFPPSAIISLTDDNSTFFLARPAAFGPILPEDGLSGPLWAGSGFTGDSMGEGELGCSDVPGWEASDDLSSITSGAATEASQSTEQAKENPLTKQPHGSVHVAERSLTKDDGTDDHLQPQLKHPYRRIPERANIKSLQESGEIAGKVVLLKRGGCGFLEKVMWAQRRGGTALIVGDNVRGSSLVHMYARGDTSNVTIPAIFTSHTTAHLLSSLLPTGEGTTPLLREHFAKLGLKAHKASTGSDNKQGNLDEKQRAAESAASTHAGHERGWLDTILFGFRIKKPRISTPEDASHRPPSSGELNWVSVSQSDQERKSTGTPTTTTVPLEEGATTVKGSITTVASAKHTKDAEPPHHEGLWVTLTPTNMSTSPFFDTLLVLVVSPLVTLTVVYALLLLRSRIRRRRWRAPKSLVQRLPVRTYHTISDTSPSATPNASSPTTPLLQHTPSRPTSSQPQSRSPTEPEAPATSSSLRQSSRTPEEEKRENGLAAWKRKYGGRQRECVVCLEDYVDGISQVMSLPCGHEFHAECM